MMRASLISLLAMLACDDATMIVVDDGYDPADGAVVYEVWWQTTLVPNAVSPGAQSPAYRTTPAADYAYALIARGWDPSSGQPPNELIAVRTRDPVSVDRGDTLHVVVSPSTIVGDCATGEPLTQAEADLITQSIFPGAFEGAIYDATTCKTARPSGPDAGAD